MHVVPGAARSEIVGPHGDALKVRVASPPERGQANEAVCRLLAEALGVRPRAVEVLRGAASRRKTIRVRGLRPDEVLLRLHS